MAEEKRKFVVTLQDGRDVELITRNPNNKEIQEAEFYYSKAYNKAIMNGIMPQSTLVNALVENGMWSEEKDNAIEKQRQLVADMEKELEKEKDEEKKASLAKKLTAERDKLFRMRQERNDLVAHSAESKAEDAQRNYLVSCVTEVAKTGDKVWPTYEDFLEEQDGGLVFRATYEFLTFTNGLESDFTKNLPENKVKEEEKEKAQPGEEQKTEEPKSESKNDKVPPVQPELLDQVEKK
ncbi:MAG: hypothetical protein ACP6IQ_02290 [Candidatus Njordarchaeia archaeon]